MEKRHSKILRYADSVANDLRMFPPSLHLSLTDQCWNQCKICGHWKRPDPKTIGWTELDQLLGYGVSNGLETVCLSGGDPLRYPEINDLMSRCLEWNIGYGIVTAGWRPPWVKYKLIAKAQWVRCSIDAVSDDYERVRGGHFSWDELAHCIERMHEAEANLQVFVTISVHNIGKPLRTLFQWISDHASWFSEVRARPAYIHSTKDPIPDSLLDDFERLPVFLADTSDHLKTKGLAVDLVSEQFHPQPFERCWASRYQLFVDATGNIYPCCITAGDTEIKSRIKPIANIARKDSYGDIDIASAGNRWTDTIYPDLPAVCRNECASRFNLINTMLS